VKLTRLLAVAAFFVATASFATIQAQKLLITGKRPRPLFESTGPDVAQLGLPAFDGAHAIWGATGQDSAGHLWFGVTAEGNALPSAHLFEYDPSIDRFTDRGDVVSQLTSAGVVRKGEHQAKIHSRIVQGPDRYLYFSSMDEEGEHEDGSQLPHWGGHLWRMSLDTHKWEHLLATPEALIAVGTGDRFVYALGYFGHVLFQFDTKSHDVKRLPIGSVAGHVSRNFVVDYRGHAFVPRLRIETETLGRRVSNVSLVEVGTDLQQVNETPLEPDHYFEGSPTDTHGITGLQEMADGSLYFTTHVGFLYHIQPPARSSDVDHAAATVTRVGWLHPNGATYVASLFTTDGADTLLALSHSVIGQGATGRYQWLTFELKTGVSRVAPFVVPSLDEAVTSRSSFYGSSTRDAEGHHYVVGVTPAGTRTVPIVLRVTPRKRQTQ
jgi:hypothetical protein